MELVRPRSRLQEPHEGHIEIEIEIENKINIEINIGVLQHPS